MPLGPIRPLTTTLLDIVAVGGAGLAAGTINAMAGGGTLIAFPCLVALGVPTVSANVTVTVGQTPGYLAGAWAQRTDLGSGWRAAQRLAVFGGIGAVIGALLLQVTPNRVFRDVVPFLILAACAALILQDRLRDWVRARESTPPSASSPGVGTGSAGLLPVAVALGGIYGGFFGAGLGIMFLALLGLFSDAGLMRNNAVKQALSFVVNVVAAVLFAFGHHVIWSLVPSLAAGSIIGGIVGARAVRLVKPVWLRTFVVLFGLAVAIDFWVT